MFGLALPAFGQYAGPAILSRGEAPAALTAPSVDFAFSLSASASYTTGLLGVATNTQGQLASNNGSPGVGITLGLSGSHRWKHTTLGMAYSAGAADYGSASYFAGISQGVSLGLTHQLSRHISFTLRESAGWFTQFPPATVTLNSSVPFDPTQSEIPTTDFYDNRTIYSTTMANLQYMLSSRLSFSFGGGYFTNLRRSSELYSASGLSASFDAQYRLSRRITAGADFGFSHYGFSGGIGGSYIYSESLSVSARFDRWTELSLFAGASRVDSNFEEAVPINPAFLAILCPSGVVASCNLPSGMAFHESIFWSPDFGIRVSRSFQHGAVYANAGESVTPGNGLFLTSRAQTASVGYGYSGLRKWSMNVGLSYVRALSLGNIQGGYGQVAGSFGMSRELFSHVSFVTSAAATQYQSGTFNPYNRLIYTVSVGLGYSSKNIPVRLF
jgi:hypothetical protein